MTPPTPGMRLVAMETSGLLMTLPAARKSFLKLKREKRPSPTPYTLPRNLYRWWKSPA